MWLLARPDERNALKELWAGEPESGLSLVTRFSTEHTTYLTRKGRDVILSSFTSWAPVKTGMRQPAWQPMHGLLAPAPSKELAIPNGGGSWDFSDEKRKLRWTTVISSAVRIS